jgi:hypothetical protein
MPANFNEFKRFCKDFQLAANEFQPFLNQFLIEMANLAVGIIQDKTPVDTGTLRAEWSVGRISGSGTEIDIEIFNGMEYASHVEYGHAGIFVPALGVTLHTDTHWTEGRFMMKIGLDQVRQAIPQLFEQEFQRWIREMGLG